MRCADPARAIPFIVFNETTETYSISQEAAEFLGNIPPPFGALAIAGKYRTGKSFLLNRAILQVKTNGFAVGPTINPCTKGLWLHTKLVDFDGLPTVVIDTEGIGALDATSTHDTRIFSLALLLSSFFIYNSVGAIDEDALNNLNLVTKISETLSLASDDTQSAVYFPTFAWVVRDFSLQLKTQQGNSITPDEYLERALSIDNDTTAKGTVRKCLRSFFPNRLCCTVVRPCDNEEDLQALNQKANIRPKFHQQIDDLRNRIARVLQPKGLRGKPISGSLLVCLAQSLVDSINRGMAPVIEDSWTMIAKTQARELLDAAIDQIEAIDPPTSPMQERLLRDNVANVSRSMCTFLRNGSMGGNVEEMLDTLAKKTDAKLKHLLLVNSTLWNKELEKVAETIGHQVEKFSTLNELASYVEQCRMSIFTTDDEDSARLWNSLLAKHLWQWGARLQQDLVNDRAQLGSHLESAKDQCIQLTDELANARDQLAKATEAKTILEETLLATQSRLAVAEETAELLEKQKIQLDSEHGKLLDDLKTIDVARGTTVVLETECAQLRNQVDQLKLTIVHQEETFLAQLKSLNEDTSATIDRVKERLREEQDEFARQMDKSTQQIALLAKERAIAKEQLAQQEEKMAKDRVEHGAEAERKNRELQRLMAILEKCNTDQMVWQQQYHADIASMRKEIKTLHDEKQNLHQLLAEHQTKATHYETHCKDLQQRLAALQDQYTDKDLTLQLRAANMTLARVEARVTWQADQLAKTETQLAQKLADLDELRNDLAKERQNKEIELAKLRIQYEMR